MAYWRIYTHARIAEKARKLIPQIEAALGTDCLEVSVKPNPEGGHIVTFATRHVHSIWSEVVVEVSTCAQRLGYGWSLYGEISKGLDLHTATTRLSGAEFVHCVCMRADTL